MLNIDDYILGNGALHDRFCASTEVLAKVVSSTPRPVTLKQLEQCTGRALAELEPLCGNLARAGLLRMHDSERDGWVLARRAGEATLEDVFRCVVGAQPVAPRTLTRDAAGQAQPEVDLLVMQATMAINQSVFRHLRQFPLDRLKARAAQLSPYAGSPARARTPARGLRYPEPAEYGIAPA